MRSRKKYIVQFEGEKRCLRTRENVLEKLEELLIETPEWAGISHHNIDVIEKIWIIPIRRVNCLEWISANYGFELAIAIMGW